MLNSKQNYYSDSNAICSLDCLLSQICVFEFAKGARLLYLCEGLTNLFANVYNSQV